MCLQKVQRPTMAANSWRHGAPFWKGPTSKLCVRCLYTVMAGKDDMELRSERLLHPNFVSGALHGYGWQGWHGAPFWKAPTSKLCVGCLYTVMAGKDDMELRSERLLPPNFVSGAFTRLWLARMTWSSVLKGSYLQTLCPVPLHGYGWQG